MRFINHLFLITICLSFNFAEAQDSPNIFQIYDQFVTSRTAATRCAKPDSQTHKHFSANFEIVSNAVGKELSLRYPERSMAEITAVMSNRQEAVFQKVSEIVLEKGCDDPSIQQVVKRFYVQAQWQPPH